MAVVAAEMGTKYYVEELKVEATAVYDEVKGIIEENEEFKKYKECKGIKTTKGCGNIKSFLELQRLAKAKYYETLDKKLNTLTAKSAFDSIDPAKKLTYDLLFPHEILEIDGGSKIQIDLDIKGASPSSEKVLTTIVTLEYPRFITEGNRGIPSLSDPSSYDKLFDSFITKDTIIGIPCKGSES